jgi:uncharacterized OsmC-like protein
MTPTMDMAGDTVADTVTATVADTVTNGVVTAATSETLTASLQRLEDAVARRPGFGVHTAVAVTSLDGALRCVTEEGTWRIAADVSDRLGGTDSAPSPSALVRAALGACMAMSYRLRAARHGLPVTTVQVTVTTESAIAGMLDAASGEPAGFRSIRFHVDIDSPAPRDDVLRVLDEGDQLSPVLDALTRPLVVERTVSISAATPAATSGDTGNDPADVAGGAA